MLPFPMLPVPNPSSKLYELDPLIYCQLCKLLDVTDEHGLAGWQKLKWQFQQIVSGDPMTTRQNSQPLAVITNSKDLLLQFERFNYSIKGLAFLLERCELNDPLHLLRETEPIQILEHPSDAGEVQVIPIGKPLKLTCVASGFPSPTYQWTLNGKDLEGETHNQLSIGFLTMLQVGSYQCSMHQKNRDGTTSTVKSKIVVVTAESNQAKILREPQNSNIHHGQQLELCCIAEGHPEPSYQWFKGNQLLPNNKQILKIEKVSFSDAGSYRCCVANALGMVWSREAIVHIMEDGPHLWISRQPRFPNKAPVELGADLILCCEAVGAEPISYQWFCNNIMLENQTHSHMSWPAIPYQGNNVLTFHCKVSNAFSSVETDSVSAEVDTSTSQEQHKASIKLALLIGNWSYRHMNPLQKVENDVCTLHSVLEDRMDFSVVSLNNLNRYELRNQVDHFCQLVIPGAYVLVYFAGHGTHYCRNDFLLPVDAPSESEYTVDDLIDKDEIIEKIQAMNPKLLVLLLDMCRKITNPSDNPLLYSTSPPSEIRPEPRRNLVLGFATSETRAAYENRSDKNGMFMKFLKKEMKRRIRVDRMLQEVSNRFNTECAGVALQQIPTITTYLAQDLTLHDLIDNTSTMGNNLRTASINRFREWQHLPMRQESTILLNGQPTDVHISYKKLANLFLNGLQVEITWHSLGHQVANITFTVQPPELRVASTVIQQGQADQLSRCSITIDNLQILQCREASLIVFIESEVIRLNLGLPLIAQAQRTSNRF